MRQTSKGKLSDVSGCLGAVTLFLDLHPLCDIHHRPDLLPPGGTARCHHTSKEKENVRENGKNFSFHIKIGEISFAEKGKSPLNLAVESDILVHLSLL